ncbi:MAG: Crp/Fnr family transcriptional regulator [Anaerolineae bacterium]|nr:Crp/Fnr family transcriptional regulator [Anaerolineae bacterium]
MGNISRLQDYPLFKDLNDTEINHLAPFITKRCFEKGAHLYNPGNPCLNIYLIESGLVRLFIANPQGKEFMIDLLSPASVVGLPMMHENQFRMAGAAAIQPAVVLSISQKDLAQLAQRSPRLMRNINLTLDVYLRKLMRHTAMLSMYGLPGRLAGILIYLSRLGQEDGERDEFELPVSQGELAGWIGASRGHLNRALARFQRLNIIRLEGQKLTLLNRDELKHISAGLHLD